MRLFIDTGPLVARYNKDDIHHEEATRTFNEIFSGTTQYTKLYTSDYIVDESITACRSRTRSHKYASDLGESIIGSKSIVLLRVDQRMFSEAWELFRERAEVDLSFTDCTSAVLAKSHGIIDVYTYDRKDFEPLGFHVLNRP